MRELAAAHGCDETGRPAAGTGAKPTRATPRRTWVRRAALLSALLCSLPAPALAAPGDLDTSFAGGGVFESQVGGRDDSGRVVLGAAQEVFLVGATTGTDPDTGSILFSTRRTAVTSLSSTGTLATGFGTDGSSVVDGTKGEGRGQALGWNGRIAIADGAGVTSVAADGSDGQHVAITLDAPAGTAREAEAEAIVQDGTGLLVVGTYRTVPGDTSTGPYPYGTFVARLSDPATRDLDFAAGAGVVLLPAGSVDGDVAAPTKVAGAVRTADGDLVVVSAVGGALHAVRLTGGTIPDPAFAGGGGTLVSTFGATAIFPKAVIADGAGRVLVSGAIEVAGGDLDMAVVRLTADGLPDSSYGGGGLASVDFGLGFASANALALDAQGRAVAVGANRLGSSRTLAVARLTPGGQPDTAFGADGRASATVATGVDQDWYAVALQSGGRIIAAGQLSRLAANGRSTMVLAAVEGGDAAVGAAPLVGITAPAAGGAFGATAPAFAGTLGAAEGDLAQVTVEVRAVAGGVVGDLVGEPTMATVSGTTWSAALPGPLDAGRYELRVSQPSDGPRGTGRRTIEFKVDRTAPVPAITTPSSGFVGRTIAIQGTRGAQAATDLHVTDLAQVTLQRRKVTGAGLGTFGDVPTTAGPGSTWSASPPSDGTYDVRPVQRDEVHNEGTGGMIRYQLDSTAPQLSVTAPAADGRTPDTTPTIGGQAGTLSAGTENVADVRTVDVSVERDGVPDGTPVAVSVAADGSWSVTWPRVLPEGDWTVRATQQDTLENRRTVDRRFAVAIPPRPTIRMVANYGTLVQFELGRGAEPGDVEELTYRLDRTDVPGLVEERTFPLGEPLRFVTVRPEIPEGAYTLTVTQRDAPGNTGTASTSFVRGPSGFGETPRDPNAPPPGGGAPGGGIVRPTVIPDGPVGGDLPAAAPGCEGEIRFGPIVAQGACFKREGTGMRQTFVSEGSVAVNGISFVPNGAGSKVIIDPLHLAIAATGKVRVALQSALGSVELYNGAFRWGFQAPDYLLPEKLIADAIAAARRSGAGAVAPASGRQASTRGVGAGSAQVKLPGGWVLPATVTATGVRFLPFNLDVAGAAKLFGLPLAGGKAVITPVGQGATIDLAIALPKAFGSVSGTTSLRAEYGKGLIVDGLTVRAPEVGLPFGVGIKDLLIELDAAGNWAGGAKVKLPPPTNLTLGASMSVVAGALKEFRVEADDLSVPLPVAPVPIVFLDQVSATLATAPLRFEGRGRVIAGPKVAGVAPVSANGLLRVALEPEFSTAIKGNLMLVEKELAFAEITATPGAVDIKGRLDWQFGPVAVKGQADGWVDGNGFYAGATATVVIPGISAAGTAKVSNVGVAACATATLGPFPLTAGFGYKWGARFPDLFAGTCGMDGYVPVRATARTVRAAQTQALSFSLPAGLAQSAIAVRGAAGAPAVALRGPGGVALDVPAGSPGVTGRGIVAVRDDGASTTWILIARPAAGTWSVAALEGSAIADVRGARPLPDPKVALRVVRGKGRKRVLQYRVQTPAGTEVTLVESGPRTKRRLGRVRGTGRLRFTPGAGPAGERRILALVTQGGLPWKELTVARYRAPATARPAKARNVKLRRRGRTVLVTWLPGAGARQQQVAFRGRGAATTIRTVGGRVRRTAITLPPGQTSGLVTVAAVSSVGTRSVPAATRLRPPATIKRKPRR